MNHIVDITHIAFAILMKISFSLYSIRCDHHVVLSPQRSVLLHHTQDIMIFLAIFVNKLTLWKTLIAFSKNPALCSMMVKVHKVEFTSWKTLRTFPCSLNCGIATFSPKYMVRHGSHASGVTINISPTKWSPVWTKKQARSWPHSSKVMNGKIFAKRLREGGKNWHYRQLRSNINAKDEKLRWELKAVSYKARFFRWKWQRIHIILILADINKHWINLYPERIVSLCCPHNNKSKTKQSFNLGFSILFQTSILKFKPKVP